MKNYSRHLINSSATLKDGLIAINQLSSAILNLFVIAGDMRLIGTLTDGDIRRALIKGVQLSDSIKSAMKTDFKTIQIDEIDTAKIKEYRERGIKLLPVLDKEGRITKVYDLITKHSILPIDAVLMAGGRGARLRPLTDITPKPMLKVGNKPIIEHNIDNLILHGIENYFITVNYLSEQIIDYFGNGEKKGINIHCIKETRPLGTIGSVSLINGFQNDNILIMNADLFTNINYEDFYLNFINENADMAIATIPYNISVPYAILNFKNDKISSFEEKPTYTYYANAGIYLIKRNLLGKIPVNDHFNTTDFIQALIDNGKKIIKYPIIGYWVDIGKHEDYKKAQEFAKHLPGI
jgi:dTDP-glucose pyrophosphorylase